MPSGFHDDTEVARSRKDVTQVVPIDQLASPACLLFPGGPLGEAEAARIAVPARVGGAWGYTDASGLSAPPGDSASLPFINSQVLG